MATIRHREGQSIWDLCLQSYGTLDLLVKFCNDNGVTDMQHIPQLVDYIYDPALVVFENNPNIYHTLYGDTAAENALVNELRTQYLITEDSASYLIIES